MTNYCISGEKPTLQYKFNGKEERRFLSDFAPIEIIVKPAPVQGTENFSNEGFQISFYSPNNYATYHVVVKDYRIVSKDTGLEYNEISCGSFKFSTQGPNIDPSTVVIDKSKKCPLPRDKDKCTIQVLYKNLVIFQDQGDYPCTYEVVCGGKCKPGEIECPKPGYPGYCCISCQGTASKIRNLGAKIRG